jgi:hypothetical protein
MRLIRESLPNVTEVDVSGCSDTVVLHAVATLASVILTSSQSDGMEENYDISEEEDYADYEIPYPSDEEVGTKQNWRDLLGYLDPPVADWGSRVDFEQIHSFVSNSTPRLIIDPKFVPRKDALHTAIKEGWVTLIDFLPRISCRVFLDTDSDDDNDEMSTNGCVRAWNVNKKDLYGKTPAHYAAKVGHVAVMQKLIDVGARLDITDLHGNTSLMIAIQNEQAAVAEFLVEPTARAAALNYRQTTEEDESDDESSSSEDSDSRPRCVSLWKVRDEKLSKEFKPAPRSSLLSGHKLNDICEGRKGKTALLMACENNMESVVQKLLESGASTVCRRSGEFCSRELLRLSRSRFNIKGLYEHCLAEFLQKLTAKTAVENLVWAEECGVEGAQEVALKFVLTNCIAIQVVLVCLACSACRWRGHEKVRLSDAAVIRGVALSPTPPRMVGIVCIVCCL